MKNLIIATIASLTMTSANSELAVARTVPASAGHAQLGSQEHLFIHDFDTGIVTASGSADWALGLVTDFSGPKTVTVFARASTAGAFVRVVTNDASGLMTSATPFLSIPVNSLPQRLSFPVINMPDHGIMFLDAIMNTNAGIHVTEFNQ